MFCIFSTRSKSLSPGREAIAKQLFWGTEIWTLLGSQNARIVNPLERRCSIIAAVSSKVLLPLIFDFSTKVWRRGIAINMYYAVCLRKNVMAL